MPEFRNVAAPRASADASTPGPTRRPVAVALLVGFLIVLNLAGIAVVREAVLAEVRRGLDDARTTASDAGARTVRVAGVFPRTPDRSATRLSVQLDRPIAPAGDVGREIADPPFTLEPPLAGRWVYASPERLDFELVRPLPPGGTWTLAADEPALGRLGYRLDGARSFEIAAGRLALVEVEAIGRDADAVRVRARFDAPVAPAALEAAATLVAEDRAVPVRIEVDPDDASRAEAPRTDFVLVAAMPDDPARSTVELRIAAGLPAAGAVRGSPVAFAQRVRLPDRFQALRIEPRGFDRDGRANLQIWCSETLDRDQPLPAVEVDPPVEDLEVRLARRRLDLSGSFVPRRTYRVRLPATLLADGGSTLGQAREFTVDVPGRPTELDLRTGSGVLALAGGRLLDLEAVNAGRVEVVVHRIEPRNYHAHLSGLRTDATAREVARTTFELPARDDLRHERALDLGALVGGAPGLYRVTLSCSAERWYRGSATVSLTDLGLEVRREAGGAFASVRSIGSSRPEAGVRVSAVAADGAVLASAYTGADGTVRLALDPADPAGAPALWLAERAGDVTSLPAGRSITRSARTDRTGRAHPGPLDCFLATDREAIRPGETFDVMAVLRDDRVAPIASLPLELALVRPDGLVAARRAVVADAASDGLALASFRVHEASPHGGWRVEARVAGTDRIVGRTELFVETFLPLRTEVEVDAPPLVRAGDGPVRFSLSARRLAGGPESRATVRGRGSEMPVRHASSRHPDLRFGSGTAAAPGTARSIAFADGSTDAEGRATIAWTPDGAVRGRRLVRASFDVVPRAGRTVTATASAIVDDAEAHLGLGAALELPRPGVPTVLSWATVDPVDLPVATDRLVVEVRRVEHEWTLVRDADGDGWRWVREERLGARRELVVEPGAAEGTIPWTFEQAGVWRITARAEPSGARAAIDVRAAGGDAGGTGGGDAGSPVDVVIAPRVEPVAPGDPVRLVVATPFAGTLLVALETDRVVAWRMLAATAGEQEVELELPGDVAGSVVFATASLVRPLERATDAFTPHRATGIARIAIDRGHQRIVPALDLPTTAEPGATVIVRLATDGGATAGDERSRDGHAVAAPSAAATAVVWAVDDGLLLPAGTRTPDPFAHFHGPRRHAVTTDDAWRRLLPDLARIPERVLGIGASEDAPAAIPRSVPLDLGPPVVVRPRIVRLDDEGRAEIAIELPDGPGAETRLRVMALVVDGDRFGAAEAAIEAVRPVSVALLAPIAVAPGDEAIVAARTRNRTDRSLRLRPVVTLDGAIRVADASALIAAGTSLPAEIRLAAGEERVHHLPIAAGTGIGAAGIRLELVEIDGDGDDRDGGDRRDADMEGRDGSPAASAASPADPASAGGRVHGRAETRLIVRPAGETVRRVVATTAVPGDDFVPVPPAGVLAGSATVTIVAGPQPLVDLAPAIDAILDYPHGCAEQTSSRMLVALAAAHLGLDEARGIDVDALVAAGTRRLAALQGASGGIGWWSAAEAAGPRSAWVTAWTAIVLAECRDRDGGFAAGFGADRVDRLLDHLDALRIGADLPPATQAIVLRALAAWGRVHPGDLLLLAAHGEDLDAAGLAHLAAGLLRAGRRTEALALLDRHAVPPAARSLDLMGDDPGRVDGGAAGRALLLESIVRLDPDHPWRAPLLAEVEAGRRRLHRGTTIEVAAGLRALALASSIETPPLPLRGRIELGDGTVLPLDPERPVAASGDAATGFPRVVVEQGRAAISAVLAGLPAEAPAAEDRGLVVRRAWLAADGSPLERLELARGDLVRVRVTLRGGDAAGGEPREIPHVAITDLLPGGLEIEHPRLGGAEPEPGRGNAARARSNEGPTAAVFDGDRVVVIASATSGERTWEWTLRATTPGRYAVPPIVAEAMYDAGRRSVHPGVPDDTGSFLIVRERTEFVDAVAAADGPGPAEPPANAVGSMVPALAAAPRP